MGNILYRYKNIVFNKLPIDDFLALPGNPIIECMSNDTIVEGFTYKNYAPTVCERMYFTPENAGRIDYFRKQIEQWNDSNLLTNEEYCFLLACLIESVSDVSNTAGVYGAFLKKWDPRAIKPIQFNKNSIEVHLCKSRPRYTKHRKYWN